MILTPVNMKHCLYTLLFFVLPLEVNAQVINGVVYSFGTETPMPQASVYYGSSLTGTLSNNLGEFALPIKPGKNPIIVSCVGYYSEVISDYSTDLPLKVYLKPKVQEMHEVTIGSDGMSREEKERIFKHEFLGIDDYALGCTILNMDDIDLHYSRKKQMLTAFCDKPIEIDNKKLGYHITYFLDRFTKTAHTVDFAGNFIFKEQMDKTKEAKILRNREDAYEGSRMQLIRALWANQITKTKFKIYNTNMDKISVDSIVLINKSKEKFIFLPEDIVVVHDGVYRLATELKQEKQASFIDETGYYGNGLLWFGGLGSQRVGSMLPFEYKSAKEIQDSLRAASKPADRPLK